MAAQDLAERRSLIQAQIQNLINHAPSPPFIQIHQSSTRHHILALQILPNSRRLQALQVLPCFRQFLVSSLALQPGQFKTPEGQVVHVRSEESIECDGLLILHDTQLAESLIKKADLDHPMNICTIITFCPIFHEIQKIWILGRMNSYDGCNLGLIWPNSKIPAEKFRCCRHFGMDVAASTVWRRRFGVDVSASTLRRRRFGVDESA